jgi:hypothetical protein
MEHSIARIARKPLVLAVVLLAACGDDDLDPRLAAAARAGVAPTATAAAPRQGTAASAMPPRTTTLPTTTTTTPTTTPTATAASTSTGAASPALLISGAAAQYIAIDERYVFAPAATSSTGRALTFAVTGRPPWLNFDSSTGTLSGSPTAADVGLHRGIGVQVSDGTRTAQLPPFNIEVVATGTRTATVAWQTPTQNEDGSPLSDLAGFQISYGRQSGDYTHNVDVPNPGVATYVVPGLVPGTYYFALTAYNDLDVDSSPSPEMTIVIR